MASKTVGLAKTGQDSFEAGAFPLQERVPANGVEDMINAFVDDQGGIQKRGGSTYRGPTSGLASTYAPVFLFDGYLATGRRTVVWRKNSAGSAGNFRRLQLLSADEASWFTVNESLGAGNDVARSRPVVIGGLLFVRDGAAGGGADGAVAIGSMLAAPGSTGPTGTVATTNGSNTLTGTGTNFTANLAPGVPVILGSNHGAKAVYAVQTVTSDTSLELATPYTGATASGLAWVVDMAFAIVLTSTAAGSLSPLRGVAASDIGGIATVADRLIVAKGDRVAFSQAGNPGVFTATDYHVMPGGANVLGMEGLRNDLLVFTTNGLYVIRHMAYDLTDDAGNPQQQLELVDQEFVLWDDMGVSQWRNTVVAPALDGVYLVDAVNKPQPVNMEAIGVLYRSYVNAGYRLGQATVFRSRYFLPVLNGDAWVDTLVCDLRTGAWSRWAGHGGTISNLARRVGDTTRSPKLLALEAETGQRLLDLTDTLVPSSSVKNDANGTTPSWSVTLRTQHGPAFGHWWAKLRVFFELDDAASDNPTVTAEVASNRPGSAFTSLSEGAGEGDTTFAWRLNKRARSLRVRLTSSSPSARLVLRSVEWFFRQSGRS